MQGACVLKLAVLCRAALFFSLELSNFDVKWVWNGVSVLGTRKMGSDGRIMRIHARHMCFCSFRAWKCAIFASEGHFSGLEDTISMSKRLWKGAYGGRLLTTRQGLFAVYGLGNVWRFRLGSSNLARQRCFCSFRAMKSAN